CVSHSSCVLVGSGNICRMSHLDVPHFPRGFVLSERPIEAPPTFVPGPILSNFYVHPWTHIETAGDAGLFVIILGHCVPTRTELPADTATHLLAQLQAGEGRFLQELADYGGRHAIIFGSKGNIRVVNDAVSVLCSRGWCGRVECPTCRTSTRRGN